MKQRTKKSYQTDWEGDHRGAEDQEMSDVDGRKEPAEEEAKLETEEEDIRKHADLKETLQSRNNTK